MQKRFWIVAYPDLTKPVGGIKQLHRVSELISSSGHLCHLIQEDETFVPFWFSSNALTVSKDVFFNNISLHPDKDVIILPETYVPVAHSIVDKEYRVSFSTKMHPTLLVWIWIDIINLLLSPHCIIYHQSSKCGVFLSTTVTFLDVLFHCHLKKYA